MRVDAGGVVGGGLARLDLCRRGASASSENPFVTEAAEGGTGQVDAQDGELGEPVDRPVQGSDARLAEARDL